MTYAQHPRSNIRIPLSVLNDFERYAPEELQRFLIELNETRSSDEVWNLVLELCQRLGQRYVSYGFTYYSAPNTAEVVIWSNLPDEWKEMTAAIQNWTFKDYSKMHMWAKLTSFGQGIAFMDQYRKSIDMTPEFEIIVQKAAEIGWVSGISIPLRGNRREEVGGFTIAGDLQEPEFREFSAKNGWTINVAGLQCHNFMMSHLRKEEANKFDLTSQHIEFLRLSAAGLEAKQIAHTMKISHSRVTAIRREVSDRFGVSSKMAIMAQAVKLDLLTVEDVDIVGRGSNTWI